MGTYAAPVFTTASSAITRSVDRGRETATNRSGPAPCSTNSRASRFARSFNPRYDSSTPSNTSAVASGVRATCSSNSTGSTPPGISPPVLFQSWST